ncbi:MAG: Bacterial regulatory protein Fis family [Acidobacteriota bacterium]|jgi:DNA-binding NtrC family response regulator|nr:Bacterial regulatory protein Fis family [Acidobacteriota bacterium]
MRSEAVMERDNLRLLKIGDRSAPQVPMQRSPVVEALRLLTLALLREVDVLGQNASTANDRGINLSEEVRRFESQLIHSALIRTNGRMRPAARLLGMKVTTLHAKIKRYNIDSKEIAKDADLVRLTTKLEILGRNSG